MKLELYRELDYEDACGRLFDQWGSGVLVTTNRPDLVEDRLNKGWPYGKGNPRYGERSPPLALLDDWFFCQSWDIIDNVRITTLPEFKRSFERPRINDAVERRLMRYDNQKYPTLRAKGMSKNGLECTFSLRKGTYPTLDEITRTRCTEYQEYLTNCVITQVDDLLNELGIKVSNQQEKTDELKQIDDSTEDNATDKII